MSISAIDGSLGASSVAAANPLQQTQRPSSVPPPASFGAAAPQISGPGQFFGKLQQLAETNPTQFKQVTQQISDQLRQQAQQSTGRAAQFENALADRYASAAQSGDLSAFKPQGGSGASGAQHAHHHHGHGGAGGGGAGGSLAAIFSNALDEINQALGATPGATGADTSPSLAT
jgi:hypothetical protein